MGRGWYDRRNTKINTAVGSIEDHILFLKEINRHDYKRNERRA